MPFATTPDNVRLHYEEAGSGTPLLFVHEFAGDHRAWEPQMRYFARRYRCITYSARGYTPSDVPPTPASYGYEKFRDDVIAMLDHLKIDKAHICRPVDGRLCDALRRHQVSAARALADARRHRLRLGARLPGGIPHRRRRDREGIRHARLRRRREDLRHGPGAHSVRGEGPARLQGILRPVREPRRQGRRQHAARLPDQAAVGLRLRGGREEDRGADADHLRRRGRSRASSRASG